MLRSICVAVALVFATGASAQDTRAASIELTGIAGHSIMLSPATLATLSRIERDVTFQTSKGPFSGRFGGVLLWDVLVAENAFDGLDHNAELRKTLLVTAADGYAVAFSVGEIHPDYGNTPLMLADTVDGKPIDSGVRVIVPGDTRGARNVRDVVRIDIR